MMKRVKLIVLVLIAALFYSCKSDKEDAIYVIEMSSISQEVQTTDTSANFKIDIAVNFSGASYTIVAGANATAVNPSGVRVIPAAGKYSQTINVEFDANSAAAARDIKVDIVYDGKTLTHTIKQAGLASGTISFSPAAPTDTIAGYQTTYNIEVASDLDWSIKSGDLVNATADITSGQAGFVDVKITVVKNTSTTDARAVSVKFTASEAGYADITTTWSATQAKYTAIAPKFTAGNLTAAAGATSGHMIGAPEGYDSYFKWGSNYTYGNNSVGEGWGGNITGAAINPTVSLTGGFGYDYVGLSGGTAHPGDPCQSLGAAYKTPTHAQWEILIGEGNMWGTYKGVNGRFFGVNASSCTDVAIAEGCIFLPAAGCLFYTTGVLQLDGSYGFYWSSSVSNANYCNNLYFENDDSITSEGAEVRGNGYSVRCIQE